MKILQNNPYRLLGVYANSPTKERLANLNRMKAFLKVGKQVAFPLDLLQYLSTTNRTESAVADADAKLALLKDQMLYAQFWFVKTTPLDDVAFNHLIAGEIFMAEKIWEKRECASSLQNRIVCALIRKEYAMAISCAEILYSNTQYVDQLVSTVIGADGNIDVTNLAFVFLDVLSEEVGADNILHHITNGIWKNHIVDKTVKPLINTIQNAIDVAKKSKGKGSKARLNAGECLMRNTKDALSQLKSFLSASDMQYQMIVDKLGLEILQCGIDYYNDSDEPDAARKAMVQQSYAMSIVVGQMAKDRCKENVDILKKIIDNLPPSEVFAEDKAIKELIRDFCNNHKGYKGMLYGCVPYLISMKEKIGYRNEFYIQTSTLLANVLLNFVINTFNEVVNDKLESNIQENEKDTLFVLMQRLRFIWNVISNIELLDLSKNFKIDRLSPNKESIEHFIEQLDPDFLNDGRIGRISIPGKYAYYFLRYWNAHDDYDRWNIDFQTSEYSNSLSARGIRIAPTAGFMSGWKEDKLIDLRTEEDYFNECKSDYEKKIISIDSHPNEYKYNEYIRKFPNGRFITKVKYYIEVSQREYKLYKDACMTIDGCKEYIEENSCGWYIKQIKDRLDDLIFEQYKSKKNMKAYVREHPNGRNVTNAKYILKKQKKSILMWVLGISIPAAVILLFVVFDWSIVASIVVAFLVTCVVLGNLEDECV